MENQDENITNVPSVTKNNLSIPMAIIVAGVFIAGAVLYSNGSLSRKKSISDDFKNEEKNTEEKLNLRNVSSSDHIRGNPNADVKIVEYSDPECPFCKRFHYTMKQVIDEYGKGGKVAWVYRHFPLDSIHPKARKESEALECANDQGGGVKFWEYMDRLMEITPSNNGLDLAQLPKIAETIGLNTEDFKNCLSGGKYAKKISEDLADGMSAGAQGTPYSIIISKNGKKNVISGAQPYENVKTAIEQALVD